MSLSRRLRDPSSRFDERLGDGIYVADTHAFAYYLASRLPEGVDPIFRDAELERCSIVLPSIVVAELIYLFEKTGNLSKIWEMFDKIELYPSFSISPLDDRVLRIIPEIKLTELHDRIIVGTAILLKAEALITKDEEITRSRIVKTIW